METTQRTEAPTPIKTGDAFTDGNGRWVVQYACPGVPNAWIVRGRRGEVVESATNLRRFYTRD